MASLLRVARTAYRTVYTIPAALLSSNGKFSNINMRPSAYPDTTVREGNLNLQNAPHVTLNRRPAGWLKQNPVLTEMSEEPAPSPEEIEADTQLAEHNGKYLEKCMLQAMEASKSRDWNLTFCCVSRFVTQLSKNSDPVPLDRDLEDDIDDMSAEFDAMIDTLTSDIRSIRHKLGGGVMSPHLMNLIAEAYNLVPVPVNEVEAFNTTLFDISLLANHILDQRDSITFDVNDSGVVSYTTSEEVPRFRVASTLLAALYSIVYSKNGLLSGVVHTPHIGLVYVYDAALLPKGKHPYSVVSEVIHYAGRPFPQFSEKLRPCGCTNGKCTCLVGDKHVYVDVLSKRVGYLPMRKRTNTAVSDASAPSANATAAAAAGEGSADRAPTETEAHHVPVPFYSHNGLALRVICENLYVDDLLSDGKKVINVAIRKFEDFTKYDILGLTPPPRLSPEVREVLKSREEPVELKRDANGRVIVPDSDSDHPAAPTRAEP